MTEALCVCWANHAGKIAARVAALAIAGVVINSVAVRSGIAQTAGLPPPEFSLRDENSVDLLSFMVYLQQTDLSIGSKEHPLTHKIFSHGDGDWLSNDSGGTTLRFLDKDSFWGRIYPAIPGSCMQPVYIGVTIGNSTETFVCLNGSLLTAGPTGSTLTNSNGLAYTKRDGEKILFDAVLGPTQITYPDGRVLKFWYYDDGTGAPLLKSVTRSDGLQLKYTYTHLASGVWSLTSVKAINNAYEYCNPTASTCSLNMAWPSVIYSFTQSASGAVFTVTDAASRVTRYTEDAPTAAAGRTVGIKLPSSASSDNITYTYCDNSSTWCPSFGSVGWPAAYYKNYVLAVTRDGQTWNYAGTPGSPNSITNPARYGFTNPVGSGKQVTLLDLPPNAPQPGAGTSTFIQLTDENGVQSNADPNGVQVKNVIKPEGNQTKYMWDGNNGGQISAPPGRGNLVQETLVPKSGSPLAQVNLYASYDTTCTNQFTCNKPNWLKDALGNQSDYKYDPTHGGVLTATLPPDANGIRPQTRYTYSQRYAWVLNASGAYVQSAAPIWVLATESYCRTVAASSTGTGCTVAADEVVKNYEYGPNSGPNNLFLRGVATTADGVTHRTCYGYDPRGKKISETEPAAGLTSCP